MLAHQPELHITSRKTYFAIYVALLVLLALTVGAYYVPLGIFNVIVSIGIALVKALLVVLFFMHVRYSSTVTRFFVIGTLFWLLILIGGALGDYFTRVGGITLPR